MGIEDPKTQPQDIHAHSLQGPCSVTGTAGEGGLTANIEGAALPVSGTVGAGRSIFFFQLAYGVRPSTFVIPIPGGRPEWLTFVFNHHQQH